jgi:hypothetical protein
MNKQTDFELAEFFDLISSDKVIKSKSAACNSLVFSP